MDKILSAFTNKYINELDIKDLVDLEKLIEIDDDNLYNFFNGMNTDMEFSNNKINSLFKNFKYYK